MLGTLGLFGGLFTAWWALLWWVLPVSWQTISPSALLMLHLLPPIGIGAAYHSWRWWQARKEQATTAAAAESAEAERAAQRAAARDKHYQQLAARQQTLPCRGVWAHVLATRDEPNWLHELPDGCFWQTQLPDEIDDDLSWPDALAHQLESLLSEVYALTPGAAWLPHLYEAHPEIEGREQLEIYRRAQQSTAEGQLFDEPHEADCRFLPGSGAIAERVQQVLQQNPHWPGVLICAVDSPYIAQQPLDEWDEPSEAQIELARWEGAPGQASIALLFLRDMLPAPQATDSSAPQSAADPYTPYWEKQASYGDERWGRVPTSWQSSLYELPVVSLLCPAQEGELSEKSVMQASRQVQHLLAEALLDAALRDYPFSSEDAEPANDCAEQIAWLVHNSGDADVGGTRLAALSTALHYFGISLNPIDEASNSVRDWGNVGCCRGLLHSALVLTHSARLQAPAVLGHFATERITVSICKPTEVKA